MGIFHRRPLCCLAFIYIMTSLLGTVISGDSKLYLALFSSVIFLIASILCVIIKKWKPQGVFISLVAFLFCIAICLSYFAIDVKANEARQYTGKRYAHMTVISSNDMLSENDSFSAYEVIIDGVRDKELSINATVLCFFETELFAGDNVYAFCELFEADECPYSFIGELDFENDSRLIAVIYDNTDAVSNTIAREASFKELFQKDHSFTLICNRVRETVKDRIFHAFDSESAPLAQGVLTGDKSEMRTELIRNFKRTGVSHVLAVSGLHITLLLGAAEALLRKLRIRKAIRCVTVSALSFALLVITGFSMSAARAIFMLLLAYLFYSASEESDSLTALFCAAAVILIIWPSSVFNIGLWMSFSATLGIITAYNYLSSKIRKSSDKSIKSKIKNLLIDILNAVLLSVSATVFVIPFLCVFFGETSFVFIPVNLFISLVVPAFLCGIPIALACTDLPFVGEGICGAVGALGKLLIKIINFFAETDIATVSLKYDFTMPILIVFVISLCVGLIIKLKRKWIALIAPSACILAFALFVIGFHALGFDNESGFYAENGNEIVYSIDNGSLTIVDISSGSYSPYREVISESALLGCTSIDSLILTHIDKEHEFTVGYVLQSNFVKELYIPMPTDTENIEISTSLCETAELCGTKAILYEKDKEINLSSGGSYLLASSSEDTNGIIFALSKRSETVYFEAANYSSEYETAAEEFDTVIFGIHGGVPSAKIDASGISDKTVIVSSAKLSLKIEGLTLENTHVSDIYPFKKLIKLKFYK